MNCTTCNQPIKEKESEFGKGFVYNLVLFAKHHSFRLKRNEDDDYSLWFNGSSDHLYELEIPKQWEGTEIGDKATWLRDNTLDLGHGSGLIGEREVTKKEYDLVFEKLEELCLLIDKELGVETIKAQWN